jgi:hypothetical protein
MNTHTVSSLSHRIALAAFLLAVAVATAALLAGCCQKTGGTSGGTSSTFAGAALDAPVVPPEPDLSAPLPSIRSYLAWSAFAYRMANSDIASRTMTPYEGVRIDSFIQLNREQGRGIEQQLIEFKPVEVGLASDVATYTATETWRYRYFSLETKRYLTPWYTTSYNTTYSVVATEGVWLVDYVEATALTPVK